MLLFCPRCGLQHIDAPEPAHEYIDNRAVAVTGSDWDNPPHRTHLCQGCGHTLRPSDVPTNGVAAILTHGANDGSPVPAHAKVNAFAHEIAAYVVRAVAELPDRNSPPEWPEAMLVTGDELTLIVANAFSAIAKG